LKRGRKKNEEIILKLKVAKIDGEGMIVRLLRALNEREPKKENQEIGEGNDAVYIQMNKLIIILR
jgi:hypothetical protein